MTSITVPHYAKTYCEPATQSAIDSVITPWDQAKSGDFVAFTQSAWVPPDERTAKGGRHQVLWRKTDEGRVEWVKYRKLAEENHPLLSEIAHLSLTIMNDFEWDRAIDDAHPPLNPMDGETFWADVIFLPNLIAVTPGEFEIRLEDADLDTLADAEDIGSYIQVVLPESHTAHEKIEMLTKLDRDMSALSVIIAQSTQDSEMATFSLNLD